MALLNPVYGLVVPFLFVFTVPLAIFAGITTTLAFSVLMFRVAVVYIDIALGFIPQYLAGRVSNRVLPSGYRYRRRQDGTRSPTSPTNSNSSGSRNVSGNNTPTSAAPIHSSIAFVAPGHRSPRHRNHGLPTLNTYAGRRSRRSSQVSLASVGTITPILESEGASAVSGSGLLPSLGIARDFEGIGGWRLDDRGDDYDWTNINSRLELPLDRSSTSRHHQTSQSGGATTPGEGSWLMMKSVRKDGSPEDRDRGRSVNGSGAGKASMSPNSSRVRISQGIQIPTALTSMDREDDYFPHIPSPKTTKKVSI